MFSNYVTIALRALLRNKAHSIINILGLSLGISCCILIALYINHEWTFDTFHSKADRIYRVYGREDQGENQQFIYTSTPYPMGPVLKDNLPEVERQVRIKNIETQVKVGVNQFNESVTIGGKDLFKMFDFEIVKGNKEGILDQQSNAVISNSLAEKYFGHEDPISKIISIQIKDTFQDFTIVAITNIPTNSSIQFDILISDLNFPRLYSERLLTSAWFNVSPETYVLLQEGSDPSNVETKFPSLFRTILGEEKFNRTKYSPGLQPLTTIHLSASYNYPTGIKPASDPKYSYILAAIAILILFVGCINFVTLSVGRSMKRAKEVGIRKVAGAVRRQLITQFIGEAVIVTFISIFIGFVLATLNLPLFNDLAGRHLVFNLDAFMLAVVTALLLIIGLIAGSYPAFVLSAFNPITILKGSVNSGSSKQELRKVLVGVQLMLSIFLISSTLIMRNQLQFLQNKNLGFDKEQMAVIQPNNPPDGSLAVRVKRGIEIAEQFKLELKRLPAIAGVCISSHDFGKGDWVNVGYTDDKGAYRTFNMNVIDDEYLTVMKMELAQGRNFSKVSPSASKRSIIVNEAFAKELGWVNALGNKIPGDGFPDHEVIGVVRDFHYASLYSKVEPLVMVEDPSIILEGAEDTSVDNSPAPKLLIRLRPGNISASVDQIKLVWEKIFGRDEFNFSFIDQALEAQYRNDQNLSKIVSIAALLAILIGSLGLYGLASLSMQNRTKEISIRKVMGATEQSLFLLLSKEYVIMILICLFLSVPVTVYLMQNWLSLFEYRVNIGWSVFVLAAVISLIIAVFALGFELLKTARAQPARTLKNE